MTAAILLAVFVGALANLKLRNEASEAKAVAALYRYAYTTPRLLDNMRTVTVYTRQGVKTNLADIAIAPTVVFAVFRLADCKPCLHNMVLFNELKDAVDAHDAQFVPVVVGDTVSLGDFLRSQPMQHAGALYMDPAGELLWLFGGASTPSICSVNVRNGTSCIVPLLDVTESTRNIVLSGFKAIINPAT